MGTYINIGNAGFKRARKSEYVDKSGLIAVVNNTLDTEFSMSCVTRCRRFGKSLAAKMLCAYYDNSCDSRSLFADLDIAKYPSFEEHLNKYPVIYVDLSDFVTRYNDETIVDKIDSRLREDITKAYPNIPITDEDDLMDLLIRVNDSDNKKFIFIIDEWDAICREFKPGTKVMDKYVNWLRRLFKGGSSTKVFAGVYLTGILPIKKYKTQSALNNFIEYSMVEPGKMSRFFGFTKDEVKALALKYDMDFDELEKWYDGYKIGDEPSMFNPNSVIQALQRKRCTSYWAATGAFDAVAGYIRLDFEGLKDNILEMLSGGRCMVNPTKFQNDMSEIHSRDDVLTVLIHLGYLSFDGNRSECYIPNHEVEGEMANAVEESGWTNVVKAIDMSDRLLKALINGNEEAVAKGVDAAHDENTSILSYNDENSLACVLTIAFYTAKRLYVCYRELASGKGFADLVLLPRKYTDTPPIVIELKYDKDADSAIDQIKRKEYPSKLMDYLSSATNPDDRKIILAGINYDRKKRTHTCKIESLDIGL